MEMRERRERLETRWGHYCGKQWGEVQRRIAIGGKVYPDGFYVEDGWPSHSATLEWRSGDGGSHKRPEQHFAEVYTCRESWLAAVAYHLHMNGLQRYVLRRVYVHAGGVPKRVATGDPAGIGRDRFYTILSTALDLIESQDKSDKLAG